MPDFLVRVAQADGERWLRVAAADALAVAGELGLPPARVLDVQPVAARTVKRGPKPEASGFETAAPQPGSAAAAGRLDTRAFCHELALLLDAGVPLLEAVHTLAERAQAAPVLNAVARALEQGQPLSQALAHEPRHFDALLRAIVSASERSGLLAGSLRRHAEHLAWVASLRSRVVAALVYPAMLLGTGVAVVLFLLLYVLPRFAHVFENLGDGVPAASQALMALSAGLVAHPAWVSGVALAGVALVVLALRWPALREALVALLWQWPLVARRWRVVALARLYRGLSVLAQSGVPLPLALRLGAGMLPTPLRPDMAQAIAAVEAGQRLSEALHAQGLATSAALRMLRVGEQAGELPRMLERAAAFHDEEVTRLADLATRALNPVLMLVMGVLIGGVVVLMYLPIFTLMEQVQ